jgi:thiamine-phosphate pyrophosphorylase
MRAWAERLGHASPTSLHLLLALLDDDEGRVAELITQAGLNSQLARQLVQQLTPTETAHSAETVLNSARLISQEAESSDGCRTEHVLFAILESEPAICTSLENAGLRHELIRHSILPVADKPLRLDEPLDLAESAESLETSRVLDAAANRAREALRVIEDFCRFVLDDALLCRETKELRHALTEAMECAGSLPLLQARDTPGDVGAAISTPAELSRHSPRQVVQANLKRLQESLRSLEEFGKIIDPEAGRSIEQIRYRAYTLERSLLLGATARERLTDVALYLLVTGSAAATSLDFLIEEAVAGGVQVIQLREKTLTDAELIQRARRVRELTRKAGALFIVNDRPDIARLADADGVHLGQDDLSIRDARRIVGPDSLIGVSTHSIDQMRRAVLGGADYLGVGPVFPSRTKEFAEFPGLEFVRQAAAETSLPTIALGGITLDNLPEVLAAGVRRVAVSSAIAAADEPRPIAAAFRKLLRTVAKAE